MAKEATTVLREMSGHVTLEWEIQNFLELSIENGEYIISPGFVLSDATWYLQVFPKGITGNNSSEWISLYLFRSRVSWDHHVSYSLGIKDGGSMIKVLTGEKFFSEEFRSGGYPRFVERTALSDSQKSSSSNGAVTIVCTAHLLDGRLQETASQTSQPEGIETLSNDFAKLLLGGNQSDLKIKVGEQEFDAHKLILAARSPVFSAMFQHNMTEKSNSGVIEIPDLDSELVKELLLYLYTGKTDIVTSKNALELYKAADKYSLDELKTECGLQMTTGLSVDSVLDVLHLAMVYKEAEIQKKGSEFFVKHVESILSTKKWESFLSQNTSTANDLLIKALKGRKTDNKNN